MRSNIIDLHVHLHWATLKAIKVSDDGEDDNAVWVPKQFVDYDEDAEHGDTTIITLPESIAKEKGLI